MEMTSAETRGEMVAGPLILADPNPASVRPEEFTTLAAEMAAAYRRRVDFFKNEYGKALPEALELAARSSKDAKEAAYLEGLRAEPAEQVSWADLQQMEDACAGDALRKWEEVKAFARDQLISGMRGAAAVESLSEMGSGPLTRARYIALRQEIARDWEPLTGMERLLVEQMAQAYTMQLYWTDAFSYRVAFGSGEVSREKAEWDPPTITKQQGVDGAAAMVDRWNRMFLRCLRQLRDLRRYSPVVIQNAGQVNVGGQQVNVSRAEGSGGGQGPAVVATGGKLARAKRRSRGNAGGEIKRVGSGNPLSEPFA